MSDILDYLNKIADGITTFHPIGNLTSDLEEFQHTASVIKQALDDGYITRYEPRIIQHAGTDMVDQVIADNITDAGLELIGR